MQCVLRVFKPIEGVLLQIHIAIDDDLLNEAFSVSNARTKKDLIHEALTEFLLKYV
jgi:Arc/MetJ family transcription regulator